MPRMLAHEMVQEQIRRGQHSFAHLSLRMKISRIRIEGRPIRGVHHHGINPCRRFVFGATERLQSLEHMVERIELFAIREVREVGDACRHARVLLHYGEHRALPLPRPQRIVRAHDGVPHFLDRPEPKLTGCTSDSDPSREDIAPEKRRAGLRRAEPEQRHERRCVVKINAPFGLSPRQQVLEENGRSHDDPARAQQRQQQEWQQRAPRKISAGEPGPQRLRAFRRMRDEPADDAARRIPEVRIQPEKVHASTVQRRTDHEHTQQEPPKGHAAGNYIPTHAPLAVAVALDEIVHERNPREQQAHAFLAHEHEDERHPEDPRPALKASLKHQEDQRRGERLGVEFMQRDEARRRRKQRRQREPDGRLLAEFQVPRDAPGRERHRREQQRLQNHEQHRVRPYFVKWQREKDDRVLVVAHQRHVEQRHMPHPFSREPQALRVECEVESPVLECRPAEPRIRDRDDAEKDRPPPEDARSRDSVVKHQAALLQRASGKSQHAA